MNVFLIQYLVFNKVFSNEAKKLEIQIQNSVMNTDVKGVCSCDSLIADVLISVSMDIFRDQVPFYHLHTLADMWLFIFSLSLGSLMHKHAFTLEFSIIFITHTILQHRHTKKQCNPTMNDRKNSF